MTGPPPPSEEPPGLPEGLPSAPSPGRQAAGDDPEERDPGLAHERTTLAWTRTALSFAALGGAVLKVNAITGLLILAVAPIIWQLGRVSRGPAGPARPAIAAARMFLIAVSIAGVSLLCLLVAIFGPAVPGALR
jgi:uncharacterized membrane protein YidH (DUF202 family)